MKRFIFEERNKICIIDLAKTVQQIRVATEVIADTVAKHGRILFVGTKKQAKTVVQELAEECGEFYVSERWLGGMLTNLTTIRQSVKTLERIEKRIAEGSSGLTKKELTLLSKAQGKLARNLSGIRGMRKPPALVIVVDPDREHIAIAEANKLEIPVMALVDTNCNPDPVDHIIACNDDALKSIKLVVKALSDAVIEKKTELNIAFEKRKEKEETPQVEGAEIPPEEEKS